MKLALKRRIHRFNTYIPYPGAITGRQMLDKLLNLLLMVVSGMGIAAALMLFLVL